MRIGYQTQRAVLLGMFFWVALAAGFAGGVTAAPALKPGPLGDVTLRGGHPDESWATPTLAGTHLKPQPPLVAEKDDRPTFTREMVSAGWRPFDTVNLYVIKPKMKSPGAAKPPVVLYLYDYTNTTKRFLSDDYCERITASRCARCASGLSASCLKRWPSPPMMSRWC